jgi:hypothetical protein
MATRLAAEGFVPMPMSKDRFDRFIGDDAALWKGVIERSGIKVTE